MKGLNLLNPEVLYDSKTKFKYRPYFFTFNREASVACYDGQSIFIHLADEKVKNKFSKVNIELIHLGLIVIGIKGLVRKYLGSKVLLMPYDNRHKDILKADVQR